MRRLSLFVALALVISGKIGFAQVPPGLKDLPNTGLDAPGATDSYWRLLSGPTCASGNCPVYSAVMDGFPFDQFWPPNTATSKWILPNSGTSDTHPVGYYIYRLTFTMSDVEARRTVISGSWAVDDIGFDIRVNEISTGVQRDTPFSFGTFRIQAGFRTGVNTLDFVVRNVPCVVPFDCQTTNPVGLRVEFDPISETSLTSKVIVIPGIMGSFLNNATDGSRIWINWPSALTSRCDETLLALALDDQGTSPAANTSTPCANSPIPGEEVLADGLLLVPGFSYDPLINRLTSGGFAVTPFAYDWRLDYVAIAIRLRAKILALAPDGGSKVHVVAHSQGGLVLRTYLRLYGADSRVDRIVYLGTPHKGAPKSYALLRGWSDFENLFGSAVTSVNFNTAVALVQNLPAVYELLPRYAFFSVDGKFGDVNETYFNDVSQGTLTNGGLLNGAVAAWITMGSANPAPSRSYAINGSGRLTLWTLNKNSSDDCLTPTADPFGDGIVPFMSSTGLPSTDYFYVGEGHGDLPQSSLVSRKVVEILKGSTSFEAGFASTPFATRKFLTAHTCSPVVFVATDGNGNRTGITDEGDLEEGIQGSQFFKFDKTEGALIPFDAKIAFSLQGAGNGIFTFAVNASDLDVNTSQEFIFKDLPVLSGMRATVAVDPITGISAMELDLDADRRIDLTISANTLVPATAYLNALLKSVETVKDVGISGDLRASLQAAAASIQRGQNWLAVNQILAFQSKLNAQARFLTQAQIDALKTLSDIAVARLQ
jgi:pimeloyl-ACP methyl ester carboxylesterase